MRITAFVTNTGRRQLADLELRHRSRLRVAEDRIPCAMDPAWPTCRCTTSSSGAWWRSPPT
jgi:hypothetical protein